MKPKIISLLFKLVLIAIITGAIILTAGCAAPPPPKDDHSAFVAVACPEMPEVSIVTPADSYRLHVADAQLYNTCRCAALRNTKWACKIPEPTKPTP